MFYSDDMKTYIPVRIIDLTPITFKFDIFDIKSMKFIILTIMILKTFVSVGICHKIPLRQYFVGIFSTYAL